MRSAWNQLLYDIRTRCHMRTIDGRTD
eukprot:COSAG02_NODE_33924_length_492_cov_0.875318_2_plen_26_part_01